MSEQPKFSQLATSIEAADKAIQKKVDNVNERTLGQKVQKLEAKINASNPTVKNKYADKLRELSGKFDDLEEGEAKEHVSKLNKTVRTTLTALNQIAKENGFPELALNVDRTMAEVTGQLTLEKWTNPPNQNGYNDISTIFKKHFGLSPRPSNPNFRRYTVHLVNQKLEANHQVLLDTESRADFKKALKYIRHNFHPGDKFDLNKVKANMAKTYMDFSGHSGEWKKIKNPSKSQPKKPSAPKYAPTNLTASAKSASEKVKQEQQFAKEFNTHRNDTKLNMELFYKNLLLAQTTKDKTQRLAYSKAMTNSLQNLQKKSTDLQSLRFKLEKADIYVELNQKVQQLQVRLEMMFAKLELNRQFNKAKSRSDAARKNTNSYLSHLNLLNAIPKIYRWSSGDKNTLTYDEAKLRVYQNVTDQQRQNLSGSTLAEYLLQKFKNNWNQVRRLGSQAFNELAARDQKFANLLSQIKIKVEPQKGENTQEARLRTAYMALKSFTYSSAGQRLSAINRGPQNPNTKEGLDAYKSRLQKIAYREAKNMEFQYGPRGASFSYPLYVKAIKLYPNSPLAKKMQAHIKSWAKWWERTYAGVSDVCHELSNASAVIAPGVGKVIGIGLSKLPGAVRLATLAKTGWMAAENAGKFGKVFQAFRVLAAGNPANLARLQAAASNGRFMLFGKGLARFSLSLGASLGRITALAGMSETVYKGSGRYVVTAAFGVPALMRGFSNRLTSAVSQDLAKSWMKNATTNPQANTNLMNAYFMHIQKTYTQEAFQKQIAPKLVAQLESQGIKNAEQQVQKFSNYLFSEGGKKSIQEAAKNNPIAKKLFESKPAPTLVIKTPRLTRQVNQLEKEFDQFFKFVENLPKSQSLKETVYAKSITEFFKKIRLVKEWNQGTFNIIAQDFNELAIKLEQYVTPARKGELVAPLKKTLDFLLSFKNRLNTNQLSQTGKYLSDIAKSSQRLNTIPTTGKILKPKTKVPNKPQIINTPKETITIKGLNRPENGRNLIQNSQKELETLSKYLEYSNSVNPTPLTQTFAKELNSTLKALSGIKSWTPQNIEAAVKVLHSLVQKIETHLPATYSGYATAPLLKIFGQLKTLKIPSNLISPFKKLEHDLIILRGRMNSSLSLYNPNKIPYEHAAKQDAFGQTATNIKTPVPQSKIKSTQTPRTPEKTLDLNINKTPTSAKPSNAGVAPPPPPPIPGKPISASTNRPGIAPPAPPKAPTRNVIKPAATQKPSPTTAPKTNPTAKTAPQKNPLRTPTFTEQEKAVSAELLREIERYQNTFSLANWTPANLSRAEQMLSRITQNIEKSNLSKEIKDKLYIQVNLLRTNIGKHTPIPIIKPPTAVKAAPKPAPKATPAPKQTVNIKPLEGAPRFSQEIQKDMNTFFSDVAKEMSKSPLNQVNRYVPTIKTFMNTFGRINSWTQETFTSATKSLETILSNLKLPFSLREAAAKPFRKIHTLLKSVQESNKFKSPEVTKSLDRSDAWLSNLEKQAQNYNRFPVWQKTFRSQSGPKNKKAS